MDQGSLRCDANLSLTPAGNPVFGTRTETKNVNSLRSVERAVRYEICRQAAMLADGGTIKQETRHFDESTGTTSPGRSKETAEDYRYFPEPDLVPLAPDAATGWRRSGRRCPSCPGCAGPGCRPSGGFTDPEMRDLVAADAVDLVAATVAAGAAAGRGAVLVVGLSRTAGKRPRGIAGRTADHPAAAGPGDRSWSAPAR